MKRFLNLMLVATMAFTLLACGEKKLTQDDLKKAETALFNEDMTANPEAAPVAIKQFCEFAKQNPDDPSAPDWLFKALEIAVGQNDAAKSEEICQQLMDKYPTYEKTPFGMFMLASFVYHDQMNDLDKARALLERIVSDYPESEITPSAEASIGFLGMTPEEIIKHFEAQAQVEQ